MINEIYIKKNARLLLLISTMIWGSAVVITKDILQSIPFFWILAIRSTGAAILLAIIFRDRLKNIDSGTIKSSLLMGVFLFLGYVFQVMGLKLTTPGKSAFLTAIYCILVPFFYWAIDKKRPDRYNILASCLCLLGIGFISLEGDVSATLGDVLTIICGVFFGLNIVTVAKCIQGRDLFVLTILQFTVFAILSWIGVIFFSEPITTIPRSALWQLPYLTILASGVCFILQYTGQKYTTPATAAVILSLEAPFTVMYSILVGLDILSFRVGVGFVLIFMAIICSETKLSFLRK